jgi:hypothetical protein
MKFGNVLRNLLPPYLGLKTEATDFSENVVDVANSCENIQRRMAEYTATHGRIYSVTRQNTRRHIAAYTASHGRIYSVTRQNTQGHMAEYTASHSRIRQV